VKREWAKDKELIVLLVVTLCQLCN